MPENWTEVEVGLAKELFDSSGISVKFWMHEDEDLRIIDSDEPNGQHISISVGDGSAFATPEQVQSVMDTFFKEEDGIVKETHINLKIIHILGGKYATDMFNV